MKKDLALYFRDEQGKLIPQERELVVNENNKLQASLKGEKVWITPLTRGEIRKFFSNTNTEKDYDEEIVLSHAFDSLDITKPLFTKEEIIYVKPHYMASIVATILKESGLEIENKKESAKKLEDDFAKN